MKTILYFPCLLLLFVASLGTVYGQNIYNFTNALNGAPNFVAANLSANNLSPVNTWGTNTPCTNGGGVSGLTTGGSFSSYTPGGMALNVDLTPAAGFQVNVTSITVSLRRSGTGPANARFAYSINGGTTWVDKGSDEAPNNGSCGQFSSHSWTLSSTATAIAPALFKFRIYFFNASNPSQGTLQVANLYINGTVTQSCVTPTAAISGGTSICNGGNTNINFTGTPNATVNYTKNGVPQFVVLSAAGTATVNTGTLTANTIFSLVNAVNGACNAALTGNAIVIVNALPNITVMPTNDSVCLGQGIVLQAAGGVSYSWSPSTTLSAATGATVTATPTSQTTYTVTGTNANNCSKTATTTIKIKAAPVATLTPANSPVFCPGGSVLMNANTGTGLAYQWQLNGSNIAGATNPSYTTTIAGDYTVVTTGTNGCSTTSSIQNVISNTPPPAVVTPASTVNICTGTSTTLTANTGIGLTYQWQFNGTDITGATNLTYSTGVPGNYTIKVIAGPNCSNTSAPTNIALIPLPATTVTPTGPVTICPYNNVVVSGPSGSALGYQWLLNNTIIAGATNVGYTANAGGNYRLVVTNTNTTCKDTSTGVTVIIAPLPSATITYNGSTSFCAGDNSLILNANAGTGLAYQWQVNNADINGENNISYTASLAGSYRVVVTNSYNCSVASSPVNIVTFPKPNGGITYNNPLVFCQGGAVALTATAGPGYSYQWYKTGVVQPGHDSLTNIVDSTGLYAVAITNNYGCIVFSTAVNVTVNPLPDPQITRSGMVLSTSNFISYQWYRDNSPIGGATNQSYNCGQNGGYYVSVVDGNGCTNRSKLVFVNNVGVKGYSNNVDIKLYPNPAHDLVYIDAPVAVNIVIRDLAGKILIYPSVTKSIDIRSFSNGVYFVQVYDTEGLLLKTEKLIKAE